MKYEIIYVEKETTRALKYAPRSVNATPNTIYENLGKFLNNWASISSFEN